VSTHSAVTDRLARGGVVVLGFGNQGEAHALNLRDSGVAVRVGARPGGQGETRAHAHGFEVHPLAEAARGTATLAMLLPDEVVPQLWPELQPSLDPECALVFAHGFNLLYGDLPLPARGDVVVVSPTGPGRVLRAAFVGGEGLPAYLAVHRDSSGAAWGLAEAYATAIGSARARLLRTTVAEETEVDLFGEQAVLCGGMNALVTSAFELLVARGYSPEIAYLECVHQLAYLAELLQERGVEGMRRGISGTALFGDLTRGPRVVGEESRAAMARVLEEIRDGSFAREWREEAARGRPRLRSLMAAAASHPIEEARRRALGISPEPDRVESRNALSKN
jgi:ketol-acid reductoisomerase